MYKPSTIQNNNQQPAIEKPADQPAASPAVKLKVIYLSTNYNNKLHCNAMVHIDDEPTTHLLERELQQLEFEIRTRDNSYPATRWKLVDLCRLPLREIPSIVTWPSHGLDFMEFRLQQLSDQTKTLDTMKAIYYYLRIL